MRCTNCGVKLSDSATFCYSCRAAVSAPSPTTKAQTTKKQATLFYIFGTIMILCGLIPMIFRGDLQFYTAYTDYLFSLHNSASYVTTTVDVITSFLTTVPNLVMFLACSLCILSGFLMLKKCHNVRGVMVISACFQFLSLLCLSLFLDYFDNNPTDVFSLYEPVYSSDHINHCVAFLSQEPYLLDFYRQLAVLRNTVAIVSILSTIIFLSLAKPHAENKLASPTRIPHAGIALMLFVLCVMELLAPGLATVSVGYFNTDIANGYADAAILFDSLFTLPCVFILFGILALCILLPKVKRSVLALPTILLLIILGAGIFLFSSEICQWANVTDRWYSYASDDLAYMGLGAAAMLTGAFLWFQAVAQGRVALGWQIAIPLIVMLLYPFVTLIPPSFVAEPTVVCWGPIVIGLFLSLLSLCFRRPKESTL